MSSHLDRYRRQEEVEPTVVENVMYSRPVIGFFNFIKLLTSLISLMIVAYALYLTHDKLATWSGQVGELLFRCIEVVIVVACVSLVIIIARFTIDYALRFREINPGDVGKHVYMMGRWTPLPPLEKQAAHYGNVKGNKERKKDIIVEEAVPSLAEMLEKRELIKPGMTRLPLGFIRDSKTKMLTPHLIEWDDLKSFGVTGKPRQGKTVTLFNLIIYIIISLFPQIIKGYHSLTICDPHRTKQSGLLKMLQPLKRWYRYANTVQTIIKAFQIFDEELLRRKTPDEAGNIMYDENDIRVLIIDEWNGVLETIRQYDDDNNTEYFDYVVKTATRLCREAAGYGLYIGLCIHTLTEYEIGSVPLRNNLLGIICHKLDTGYSKHLFHDRKDNTRTPKLRLGEAMIKNAETGDIVTVEMPLGTREDAIAVANILEEIELELRAPTTIETAERKQIPEQIIAPGTTSNTITGSSIGSGTEVRREAVGRENSNTAGLDPFVLEAALKEVGKLIREKKLTLTEIRKALVPDVNNGRALQYVNAALQAIQSDVNTEELSPSKEGA